MASSGVLMSDESRREIKKALKALRKVRVDGPAIQAGINECLAKLKSMSRENSRLGTNKSILDRMTIAKHSYQGGAKVVIKFSFLQDDKEKVVAPKTFLRFLEPNARREVASIIGRGGYHKLDMVLSMK